RRPRRAGCPDWSSRTPPRELRSRGRVSAAMPGNVAAVSVAVGRLPAVTAATTFVDGDGAGREELGEDDCEDDCECETLGHVTSGTHNRRPHRPLQRAATCEPEQCGEMQRPAVRRGNMPLTHLCV